jgi:tripartite-type tricarboxylate transporter receptor subunit TctC
MQTLLNRASRVVVTAALTLATATAAWAQTFPSRPITLICPWPAGGGADAQMRSLAEAASKVFGQRVIIENRAGATGTIGASALAAAKPDGYTLSQLTNAVYRQPHMGKTTYDPAKDFTFVLGVSGYSFGIVVRADAPWKTLEEFLAYAKANPGKVTFGTFGNGSPPHVVMDRIAAKRGIEWQHVPFKGTAESVTALLGGHVGAVAEGTGWGPFVDSGKARLLATMGDKRLKKWPNAPTLKELGFEIVESSPWALAAPKGIDPAIAKTLHDGFKKAMEDPKFIETLDTLGQEPLYMSPDAYARYASLQMVEQKAIVEKYNLRLQ